MESGIVGYIIFSITILIFIIFYFNQSRTKKYSEAINKMSNEEKIIIKKIIDTNGPTYQADLIRDTGFSKVRIVRILRRLESRDLIERKRRGMSNVVFLNKLN